MGRGAERDAPRCNGCGAKFNADAPSPTHCGECPPWICDGCGERCSMAVPCDCWISLEGMALADIKGLLALGDLSVTPTSQGGTSA